MPRVEIFYDVPCRGIPRRMLKKFLRRAAGHLGLECRINVILAGLVKMKELNMRFLGCSSDTDVIAFGPWKDARYEKKLPCEIYISLPAARRQASEFSHGVTKELKLLVSHGLLHLKGMDDSDTSMRKKMLEAGEALAGRFDK